MTQLRSILAIVNNDICSMLNERVGKNLRTLRVMNGYSQEQVEIGVDVSRSTLSKIENGTGKIDLDRLEKFASFFKIDVINILAMSNKEKGYSALISNEVVHEVQTEYRKTDVELARCEEKSTSLKKEVGSLKQELNTYKSQIKDKELIIKLLSK